MAEKLDIAHAEATGQPHHVNSSGQDQALELGAPMEHVDTLQQAEHIRLTWKSWMVVFVSCFAIMAQVSPLWKSAKGRGDGSDTVVGLRGGSCRLRHSFYHSRFGRRFDCWLDHPRAAAHAKRSQSRCWKTVRCSGPEVSRRRASTDCIRGSHHVCRGQVDADIDRRRSSHRHHFVNYSYSPGGTFDESNY